MWRNCIPTSTIPKSRTLLLCHIISANGMELPIPPVPGELDVLFSQPARFKSDESMP